MKPKPDYGTRAIINVLLITLTIPGILLVIKPARVAARIEETQYLVRPAFQGETRLDDQKGLAARVRAFLLGPESDDDD
jgi:hypothetical protein